jgi:hypothetical protein
MATSAPQMTVFLTPETASVVDRLCEKRGLTFSHFVRAAVIHLAANPSMRFEATLPGRTRRVRFYIDPKMRQGLRETALSEGIPMSKMIASAIEDFTLELLREKAGKPASPEILRTWAAMREIQGVAERTLARQQDAS